MPNAFEELEQRVEEMSRTIEELREENNKLRDAQDSFLDRDTAQVQIDETLINKLENLDQDIRLLKGQIDIKGGNMIRLSDSTEGGGSTEEIIGDDVVGDAAQIELFRSDDPAAKFLFRKRASKNTDADNVFEMFYDQDSTADYNLTYIGRRGVGGKRHNNYLELTADADTSKSVAASNGRMIFIISEDEGTEYTGLVVDPARNALGDGNSGTAPRLIGNGDGLAGLSFISGGAESVMLYVDSDSAKVGDDFLPDVNSNGTTGYDLGSSSFQFKDIYAHTYYANGNQGASGSFTTADSKTVTVTNGIITSIV